jgi:hypothetical protein
MNKWPLLVGIVAMLGLVLGTFMQPGASLQKWTFLAGSTILGFIAYVNDEKLLTTLQAVVAFGGGLAFVPDLAVWLKVMLLGGAGILGTGWLLYMGHVAGDRWWPLGVTGLVLSGFALAISGTDPFVFNLLLACGANLLLLYNLLSFLVDRVQIQIIWVGLNGAFMIKPTLNVISMVV